MYAFSLLHLLKKETEENTFFFETKNPHQRH